MSKPIPQKYKTTNWRCYNAALKSRGSLSIWFDPGMDWRAAPTGKQGRQPTFSDAAIQTCLTLKVLFRLPLRQVVGLVESLLKLADLDLPVPDFSTLSRRQKSLAVMIPYRGSKGPLHLLIDSTGIKAEGEGEWHTRKHGPSKPRQWRKVHIGIDADTLEIRAIHCRQAIAQQSAEREVTSNSVGDAPMLPELLSQVPDDQEIGMVTADGAYDTRACHNAIANRGAHAVIPTRRNAKPWKPTTSGAEARNEILRATKYLGRAIWRRWSGYHRRSLVETKMHCVKLLGDDIMAREFDRQVTELQVRAVVLNGFTALGIPQTHPLG